jgi:hypothetical protein
VVRSHARTRHEAELWTRDCRAATRIEATRPGLDIRFVVINLDFGSAEWIYDSFYCTRSHSENLTEWHTSQLASDRTSCGRALANQPGFVMHTAAYWLMLCKRGEIVKRNFAHVLERGGERRAWLSGHENIHKRYLVHIADYNPGLLMRAPFGAGAPKETATIEQAVTMIIYDDGSSVIVRAAAGNVEAATPITTAAPEAV